MRFVQTCRNFCTRNHTRLSPDNIGVVGLPELFEERDLPEDGHRDPVLGEGELDLLDGHDLVTDPVPRLVHSPVGA